jgi:methionyl-tRNA formyltransferase
MKRPMIKECEAPMNIIYMGTPEFAVAPLRALVEAGHKIQMVISQPDRPRDRGKKIQPTPVAAAAAELGLPLLQPASIKNDVELEARLRTLSPDVIIVVAYGKLLPVSYLSLPRYGCVNIHGSLLPRHRGAAPVQHSILAGDEETGVTLMYLSEGMDEGDMIVSRATKIETKSAGELLQELSHLGASLLTDTLPAIEQGTAARSPQDPALATYAPMLTKQDGHVEFKKGAVHAERQIRAMDPWPGAFVYYKEDRMKLLKAIVLPETGKGDKTPGQILSVSDAGLDIQTSSGILRVTKIQMPGKRPMEVSDHLKGNQFEINCVLR